MGMAEMMKQPGTVGALGLRLIEMLDQKLSAIEQNTRNLYDYQRAKKYVYLLAGGVATGATAEATFQGGFELSVPAGYTFNGQRLIATAPEGAKLQIYRDRVTPTNLVEVASNVQEYADGILGQLNVRGPATLIAVLSGMKATGSFSIALAGDLTLHEPQPVQTVR